LRRIGCTSGEEDERESGREVYLYMYKYKCLFIFTYIDERNARVDKDKKEDCVFSSSSFSLSRGRTKHGVHGFTHEKEEENKVLFWKEEENKTLDSFLGPT